MESGSIDREQGALAPFSLPSNNPKLFPLRCAADPAGRASSNSTGIHSTVEKCAIDAEYACSSNTAQGRCWREGRFRNTVLWSTPFFGGVSRLATSTM